MKLSPREMQLSVKGKEWRSQSAPSSLKVCSTRLHLTCNTTTDSYGYRQL